MAAHVLGRDQYCLGWLPRTVDRNAYGRQRESFAQSQACPAWGLTTVPALFIRAPRFLEVGPEVTVLSRLDGDITGVCYQQFTAVTYHPELGGDNRFHQAWCRAGLAVAQPA